jgi:dTDP-4-dehydrorhamnose 3,5-epimerase-like enzyme
MMGNLDNEIILKKEDYYNIENHIFINYNFNYLLE